jgi:hypothetical protein
MMPGAGGDANTVLPLVLSIVSMVFCCGNIGLITGIVGLIFAIQAGGMKTNGDIEGARAKAKLSLIIVGVGMIVSVVLGILLWALGVIGNS